MQNASDPLDRTATVGSTWSLQDEDLNAIFALACLVFGSACVAAALVGIVYGIQEWASGSYDDAASLSNLTNITNATEPAGNEPILTTLSPLT